MYTLRAELERGQYVPGELIRGRIKIIAEEDIEHMTVKVGPEWKVQGFYTDEVWVNKHTVWDGPVSKGEHIVPFSGTTPNGPFSTKGTNIEIKSFIVVDADAGGIRFLGQPGKRRLQVLFDLEPGPITEMPGHYRVALNMVEKATIFESMLLMFRKTMDYKFEIEPSNFPPNEVTPFEVRFTPSKNFEAKNMRFHIIGTEWFKVPRHNDRGLQRNYWRKATGLVIAVDLNFGTNNFEAGRTYVGRGEFLAPGVCSASFSSNRFEWVARLQFVGDYTIDHSEIISVNPPLSPFSL